ncbi:thiamine pyrophosphate-binding protein [Streptomyces scopuliridis]|uniref:thiamine pyrophosphate-binding protein n=1 Tax=Streptomyces scopuliridis TaxID=452529 RepID=UPI0036C13C40
MTDLRPANSPTSSVCTGGGAGESTGADAPRPRRGADVLVDALIAGGVSTLFGVPGDTGVALYDALYHRTDDIRHILARDERHAGAMADAYARSANRVGVVEVSSGGGTTYVVGGLGDAYASGVPVLLLTSDIHARSRDTGALTEIDQTALFSAVTKWTRVAESAEAIPRLVREALVTAVSGRPAPVALIVPENVLDEPADTVRPVAGIPALPAERTAAEPSAVARAAELLSHARRPTLLVGSGVHLSGAWDALERLADTLGAAVATSIHGKGSLPDTSEWSLGVVGNNGGLPGGNAAVRNADVVLLVGTRANATDTDSWTGPARDGTTVIQIDIDAHRAGRNFPGAVRLVGDAATVLGQLLDHLTPVSADSRASRRAQVRAARETTAGAGVPGPVPPLGDGQLLPADVVRSVNAVLGPDTFVVADPGTPTPNVAAYWQQSRAARSVLIPRGHGPMGYAIPAAIGVAVAQPGREVVSFTADGSFAMACGELETTVRLQLPVLHIQFTNHSLGWIKMLQHLYTGRRYFGVDPGTIDAVGVARACGMPAHRVTSLTELTERLREFRDGVGPLYLDIEVPHMIDYTPPVPAWDAGRAGHGDRPVY